MSGWELVGFIVLVVMAIGAAIFILAAVTEALTESRAGTPRRRVQPHLVLEVAARGEAAPDCVSGLSRFRASDASGFGAFTLLTFYTALVVGIVVWSEKLASDASPKSVMAAEAPAGPPTPRPLVASCRCSCEEAPRADR